MEVEGAIEVPGEANPLTEGLLFHVLKAATSNDHQQVQSGTKQLQQWESQKGYYSLLQSVFIDKSLPTEVRYLAIIQLKNGIDRYWRRTALNAVSKEEKALIRSRLYESGLDEANQNLALQNAVVIAKIVRYEYPRDWPDAITSLIDLLRTSSDPSAPRLRLPRTLLILLHVVKELSTGRLRSLQTNLQAVTPEVFHVLGNIYLQKVQRWQGFLQNGGDDEGGALDDIEQTLLCLKVLRRLLIAGYEFPNRDNDVQQFWGLVRNQFGDFLNIATQEPSPLALAVRKLIEKHLLQLAKFHLEMARMHAAAFMLLPESASLVRAYWGLISKVGESFGSKSFEISNASSGDEDDDMPILEKISLKGLLLIRACLKMVFNPTQTFKYRSPQDKEEKKQAEDFAKAHLFSNEWVTEMLETIVSRFFVFRDSDLREWQEDPEEWERKEDSDSEGYEYAVRPCAEKLFLDLSINYKELVIQPLLNVFQTVASPDNDNILFKDSVYTAIGLGASVLHQHLDFDSFIKSTLAPEAQMQKPGYNILRRRIAILLSQWVTVKISIDNRPVLYQIYTHLLDKNDPLNDLVVRITAGRHFKNVADEWEFVVDQFLPYAPEILSRLMALIEEVESTETKMSLLNTISVIVERLEHRITPYAERIVALLPPLWEQSGDEHLMKQAILTILTRLINAMKSASLPFHPLVLPIIKGAVEPGSDTQIYLLDDALDLWASVLHQTPAPASPELISLAQYLFDIFDLGSESLRQALEITESYLLLAPHEMLADGPRQRLLASLTLLLGTVKPNATGMLTDQVEVMVRTAAQMGGEQGVEVVVGDLASSGFLGKVLQGLKGAWRAHRAVGPRVTEAAVDGVVETDYWATLARIGCASPRLLLEAVRAVDAAAGLLTGDMEGNDEEGGAGPWRWLLEEWFGHVDNVGDLPRKKLMGLALTQLLAHSPTAPWLLRRFLQDYLHLWTQLVEELVEGQEDRTVDCLVWAPPDPTALSTTADSDLEPPEDARRRDLIYSDPVHTVNLVAAVREHFALAVRACGGREAFQAEWLVNVDREVVEAFGRLEGVV